MLEPRLADAEKIVEFSRLEGHYPSVAELFHIERDGRHYLLNYEQASGTSYDLLQSGSRSQISQAFKGMQDRYEKVNDLKEVSSKIDAQGRNHLKFLLDKTWGVELKEKKDDAVAQDFNKQLDREVRNWRGSFSKDVQGKLKISFVRHPYYPEFRKQFLDALQKEFGGRLTLYRGVYGDNATEAVRNGKLKVHRFSSWSSDKSIARDVARQWRKGKSYAIVKATFSPNQVLLGAVDLKDYVDPKALLDFYREKEFVIQSRGSVPVKVVSSGGMKKTADYPDHPKDLVIKKNALNPKDIREIDVWNYYEGIKSKLIPELKGRDLFVVVAPSPGKEIYVRHPYDKKTEFIRINNDKSFETYHSGRTVEYHRTSPVTTDEAVFDFDPGPSATFSDIKNAEALVEKFIKDQKIFKPKLDVRFTGSRGFHITAYLKKKDKITNIKNDVEQLLADYFADEDSLTIAKNKPPGSKVNVDLSPMKVNGGHIAPWSLRIKTGLVCVPVSNIKTFKKSDATLDKAYKKLTGKTFIWEDVKEAGLNRYITLLEGCYMPSDIIQSLAGSILKEAAAAKIIFVNTAQAKAAYKLLSADKKIAVDKNERSDVLTFKNEFSKKRALKILKEKGLDKYIKKLR